MMMVMMMTTIGGGRESRLPRARGGARACQARAQSYVRCLFFATKFSLFPSRASRLVLVVKVQARSDGTPSQIQSQREVRSREGRSQ